MKLGEIIDGWKVAGLAKTHVLLNKGTEYKTVTPEQAEKLALKKPKAEKVVAKPAKKKAPAKKKTTKKK